MEIRVHRIGNEAAWWKETGIDPLKVAASSGNTRARVKGGSGRTGRCEVPDPIGP